MAVRPLRLMMIVDELVDMNGSLNSFRMPSVNELMVLAQHELTMDGDDDGDDGDTFVFGVLGDVVVNALLQVAHPVVLFLCSRRSGIDERATTQRATLGTWRVPFLGKTIQAFFGPTR